MPSPIPWRNVYWMSRCMQISGTRLLASRAPRQYSQLQAPGYATAPLSGSILARPTQVMIVDSAELFDDFVGTVERVAAFSGLPPYKFKYEGSHMFRGACNWQPRHSREPDFFAPGGM